MTSMDAPPPLPRPLKPHLTIAEQVALLRARGMAVADEQRAAEFLRHLGYYRFSGYAYPFRRTRPDGARADDFIAGVSFNHVMELCAFDQRLRLTALEALAAIEVSVRAVIAYRLGAKDPLAHRHPAALRPEFATPWGLPGANNHAAWLQKHDALILRAGREDFVRHHRDAYDGRIPIWASVELWDFGLLSKFFSGMRDPDQRAAAKTYGVPNPGAMASWLRAMNFVRNVAAHHGRLWNRVLVDHPQTPPAGAIPGFAPPPPPERYGEFCGMRLRRVKFFGKKLLAWGYNSPHYANRERPSGVSPNRRPSDAVRRKARFRE